MMNFTFVFLYFINLKLYSLSVYIYTEAGKKYNSTMNRDIVTSMTLRGYIQIINQFL